MNRQRKQIVAKQKRKQTIQPIEESAARPPTSTQGKATSSRANQKNLALAKGSREAIANAPPLEGMWQRLTRMGRIFSYRT